MPSRFKHIFHFLLATMLLMGITSCTSWRDAREIVEEAESLLAKGVILKDTAVLAGVIRTLEPFGRLFAREDLVKAYYLLGRNMDDYYHDFSTAADYYIEADRLKTNDLVLRGRINSCMGYLCKQDSCFAEALIFYEISSLAFKESENNWYYTPNLLNIAEQYVNLREYAKSDSVLDIANDYEIDSAYYARMVDVRALALFNQQLYDSALVYLLSIEDYPRNLEAKCYSYQITMQIYNLLNELGTAMEYAGYIITNSNNPNYRSNAYYHLINYAKVNDNLEQISLFSGAREDEDRILRHSAELHAQATIKLKAYLETTNYTKLIVLIIASLFGALGIGIGLVYKRHRCVLQKHAKEKQDRRDLLARRIYDHSIYFTSNKIWKDYKKLRELGNNHFGNMFYRLEDTYHLSEQEIKICLMILLEYTNKQMAEILFVQPNTISKAKNKIAKQLNTSSAQLRASLIDILA